MGHGATDFFGISPIVPRRRIVPGARRRRNIDRHYGDWEYNPVCAACRRADGDWKL